MSSAKTKKQDRKPKVISQNYALVPVGDLAPHPKNPRKGAIEAIDESIAENGFYGAVVVQKSTSLILAGRHRWERAQAAGIAAVPVIWADVDDATALRILTADNRTSDLALYDTQALAELLDSVKGENGDFKGTGYDQAAFDEILAQAGDAILAAQGPLVEDEPPQIDRAEELLGKWPVERGQIWEIGKHRLMCGDSTSEADLDLLMGGAKADMVFTDPPYGIGYLPDSKLKALGKLENDHRNGRWENFEEFSTFLDSCVGSLIDQMRPGACYYVCMGWEHLGCVVNAFAKREHRAYSVLVWDRVTPRITSFPQDYIPVNEFIVYGWKRGKNRDRQSQGSEQTTIWRFKTERAADMIHTTQKPVAVIENALLNSSSTGDLILDCFGGSGSTMAACQGTNRIASLMELDPRYCAVTLERMQKLGIEPKLTA